MSLNPVIRALKLLKQQADKDRAEQGEVGSFAMQELEAQIGWEFTMVAGKLLHILSSWQAAEQGGADAPSKVLVAYWHDTVGATPNSELANADGDRDALVEAVTDYWLRDMGLASWQINDIRHNLFFGNGADIPPPPDASTSLAQITIEEYNADDPLIQWVFEEE